MATQTKRDKAEERREKAAALRRAEQSRKRRNRILLISGAVVVVAAIAVVVVLVWPRGGSSSLPSAADQVIPTTPTGATTTQPTPTRVKNTTGISGVLAWDTEGWPGDGAVHAGALGHDHVNGPVKYAVTPPVGGPHNAIWMNAGVYTKPIPNERAVHNLEHGGIWITYDPNTSKADVATLTKFVTKQTLIQETATTSNRYIDLSPWASNSLPSPIVISSWGYQLRVTSPTDPRLQQFVDKFRRNQTYSPEFPAPVDGQPVNVGGRPAYDGTK